MTITLTPRQMAIAWRVGREILRRADARGGASYFLPHGETQLDVDVRGMAAELAASIATGLPWHTLEPLPQGYRRGRSKPPDIGRRTEVRNSARPQSPLYVYQADPPDRCVLLVTGVGPSFTLAGWIQASDAKRPEFWRGEGLRYPAYVIPQSRLQPLPLPPGA